MSTHEKDTYYVAVKVFLRDKNKLLIIKDIFDDGWDLPGGRIKKDEFATPLTHIVKRKVAEELGESVHYDLLSQPKVFFRHERLEEETKQTIRIFALGYEAVYKKGAIELGGHMDRYEWVDISDFDPSTYMRGGWLKGVEEYLQLVRDS